LIAVLILRQTNNKDNDDFQFVWNIYANNNVVVPTGGCDVSARDVTVTLPEYPASAAIPLTVYCAQNQNLGYYLSGTTENAPTRYLPIPPQRPRPRGGRSADA
jgi:minor fimbrial subunit